jgi:hypothetical protein
MNNEEISIVIWCWHDLLTDATQLRLVRADTSKDVLLNDGSFLLRISIDAKTSVLRCFIRHIASGREAYVQGGPKLRTFIETCLLHGRTQDPGTPEVSGM